MCYLINSTAVLQVIILIYLAVNMKACAAETSEVCHTDGVCRGFITSVGLLDEVVGRMRGGERVS